MELGIHLSLWAKEFTEPFINDIGRAAQLGFDSVEIPLMNPVEIPVERVIEELERNNLEVYCGTGLGLNTDISSPEQAIRENGLSHILACLEVAHRLGSPSLDGVIHSAWGKKDRVGLIDRKRSAEVLKEAANKAGELDMELALECINRYESSFLNTVEQGLELLGLIGMPNVGLHLDTYHMNIEEKSIPAALVKCGSKLYHLHLSENNRGYPGNGSINWRDIFEALKKINYTRGLVIESFVVPETSAGDEVCIWRQIEKDTEDSLRESVNYIKQSFSN